MTPDVSPTPEIHPWKKAIPQSRDRLQSKIIVWLAVPMLGWLLYWMILDIHAFHRVSREYIVQAMAISLFFALIAWRMKAATPLAAIFGGVICLLITIFSGLSWGGSVFHSGLTPLIVLFLLTREATRLGRSRKADDSDEARVGRSASQIIANLGVAAYASSYFFQCFGPGPRYGFKIPYILANLMMPMLAALAEATADTVSSEIGQAFGGTPFLLTTFRRVEPGTDGAISVLGTLAGVGAAGIIALVGIPALGMYPRDALYVFTASVAGLFFDSLLGATVEKWGWLGNDAVNLASTFFAFQSFFWIQTLWFNFGF